MRADTRLYTALEQILSVDHSIVLYQNHPARSERQGRTPSPTSCTAMLLSGSIPIQYRIGDYAEQAVARLASHATNIMIPTIDSNGFETWLKRNRDHTLVFAKAAHGYELSVGRQEQPIVHTLDPVETIPELWQLGDRFQNEQQCIRYEVELRKPAKVPVP